MLKSAKIAAVILALLAGTTEAQQAPPNPKLVAPSNSVLMQQKLQALRTRLAAVPASRPTRKMFLEMVIAAQGDKIALRKAIESANVQLKVNRICHVFGGYSDAVYCVRATDAINDLQRSQADTQIFNIAMNDLFEAMGGSPTGGDINTCGGRLPTSITNVRTDASRPAAALSASPGGSGKGSKAQKISASDAMSKVSTCRSAQRAALGGSMGTRHVPGSPDYRRAVGNAQTFLGGIGASCRESGNSMVAAPPGDSASGSGSGQMGMGDALSWVAGTTNDLAGALATAGEAMEGCSSKAKCALNIIGGAVGLVSDATDLAGDSTAKEWIKGADTVLDVTGAVAEVITATAPAAAAATTAEMVLPAIAVGTAAYTVASPVGEAIANFMDPVYVKAADFINGVDNSPASGKGKTSFKPGGGVGMPAEDGRSCAGMADRAANFNAYCSQPGNDWQSYDCMSFVARLNHCADPGLVTPAPGTDFQCSGRRSEQDKRRMACEQNDKLRGWLAQGAGSSPTSNCAATASSIADFQQRQRAQLCQRVNVDDPSGLCGGVSPSSRTGTATQSR